MGMYGAIIGAFCVVDQDGNRVAKGENAVITASLNGINPCAANNNGADMVSKEI